MDLSQEVERFPNTASVNVSEVVQLCVVENSQCRETAALCAKAGVGSVINLSTRKKRSKCQKNFVVLDCEKGQ